MQLMCKSFQMSGDVVDPEAIWWEKTVEYKFVLDADRERGLKFAAPLSGVHERAGDGVFSSNSKIVLVEFKRSKYELDTEYDKFTNYENAVAALAARDSHHFLIYGGLENDKNEFRLYARTYFSKKDAQSALAVLNHGLEPLKFNEYLADLVAFKKADGRSSGTVTSASVASAIGISQEGEVSAISLVEYCNIVMPNLGLTPTETEAYQPPTPGY